MREGSERLIILSEIRQALVEAQDRAPDLDSVRQSLAMLDEIIEFQPGDLIEYQRKDGEWMPGVVVAHALHRPCYICGGGDDREAPQEPLLSCPAKYVRRREGGAV